MNGMTNPFEAKRDETKQILSYLTNLGLFIPVGIFENEQIVEVAFKVSKDASTWPNFMKVVTSIPNVFINKKFLNNEGKLVYCWSIQTGPNTVEELIKRLTGVKVSEQNKPIQTSSKKPDLKRRLVSKPIVKKLTSGETVQEWTINLPHVRGEINKPGFREDGQPSAKGAFSYGGKEWARTISYHKPRRR